MSRSLDMAFSSSSSENTFEGRSFHAEGFRGPSSFLRGSSGSSKSKQRKDDPPAHGNSSGFQFDILAWYPKYQSCQKYFIDHAQHDVLVQAFAAFVNILLPCQRNPPLFSSRGAKTATERLEEMTGTKPSAPHDLEGIPVSLLPYIRRLVATGMDVPQILHGFFGNDWTEGVGPQREQERRNYLFAAKSGGWASVKKDYDMLPLETVPFLRPLGSPADSEIEAAEKSWSEWLAMEDWMVGSRTPYQNN